MDEKYRKISMEQMMNISARNRIRNIIEILCSEQGCGKAGCWCEKWKRTCGNRQKSGQNAEKSAWICGRISQLFEISKLYRLDSVETRCVENFCAGGKTVNNGVKPCVSGVKLWKTMWIMWKSMGINVWNACVQGDYAGENFFHAKFVEF